MAACEYWPFVLVVSSYFAIPLAMRSYVVTHTAKTLVSIVVVDGEAGDAYLFAHSLPKKFYR